MSRNRSRQAGFSFTELMFAIIVLGIGFILVAAIFPVAISQSQTTVDDTTGANFGRSAINYISNISSGSGATVAFLPVTDGRVNENVFTTVGTRVWPLVAPGSLPLINVPAKQSRSFGYMVPMQGPLSSTNNTLSAFVTAEKALNTNSLSTADARYAWTALVRRDVVLSNSTNGDIVYRAGNLPTGLTAKPAPFAQVIVVAMRIRNIDGFDGDQMKSSNLRAGLARFKLTEGERLGQPDLLWFTNDGGAAVAAPDYAVTGAFVIVGDDFQEDDTGTTFRAVGDEIRAGRLNGKVLQLGPQRLDLNGDGSCFELAPGYDLTLSQPVPATPGMDLNEQLPTRTTVNNFDDWKVLPTGTAAAGWIIGAGLENPRIAASAANRFTGPAQDIAIYTSFVPVNP